MREGQKGRRYCRIVLSLNLTDTSKVLFLKKGRADCPLRSHLSIVTECFSEYVGHPALSNTFSFFHTNKEYSVFFTNRWHCSSCSFLKLHVFHLWQTSTRSQCLCMVKPLALPLTVTWMLMGALLPPRKLNMSRAFPSPAVRYHSAYKHSLSVT